MIDVSVQATVSFIITFRKIARSLSQIVASNQAFCDFGHRAFQRGASKFSFMNIAEHWEGVMRNLFGLLLAVALAAGAAALVTPHPSAATPILVDYSGASY